MPRQMQLFGNSLALSLLLTNRQRLNVFETDALRAFAERLEFVERRTRKPWVIAMIGLVGSGKSSVAREFSSYIGASVIDLEEVALELEKHEASREGALAVALTVSLELIKNGANIILDSDFIERYERGSLRRALRGTGAKVRFVRTYTDLLKASIRLRKAGFRLGQVKADKNIFRMWSLAPKHYTTTEEDVLWALREPPCRLLADIDTTHEERWKEQVAECANDLLDRE